MAVLTLPVNNIYENGLNTIFFNYYSNVSELDMTDTINQSPDIIKDINEARGTLSQVKFLSYKDIFEE